jgi:hypothetical protein
MKRNEKQKANEMNRNEYDRQLKVKVSAAPAPQLARMGRILATHPDTPLTKHR